jgi:hypothetical protein
MNGTHTGIRLRLVIGGQPILDGDSDWLHMAAIFAGEPDTAESPAVMASTPGERPWHQMAVIMGGPIEVWVQAVNLPDEYPDDTDGPWDGA